MSSFIYLVGKSDPHSESIAAAKRLGFNVGIFQDKNIQIKNPERFDRVIPVDFSNLDEAISRFSKEELEIEGLLCTYENYIVAKSKIARHLDLPASTIKSAEASTDKYLMRQAFQVVDASITPRFAHISSRAELLAFAASTTYPLIIKPTNLVKSLLVLKCDNEEELIKNFAYAKDTIGELYEKYNIHGREPQLIVEEFIQGKVCSIAAFVDNEGTPFFCDGIVDITTAQERNVSDNYLYRRQLPASLPKETLEKLFTVAEKGVRALDMRSTPAHIELIYNDTEVKIVEIGARIGGYRPRMYRYSYDIDLIEQEVKLAIAQKPDLEGSFKAYSAVYELFAKEVGTFVSITGLDDPQTYQYFKVSAKPGQKTGPAKNGYKAAAIVIVVEQDEQKFNKLCQSVDKLSVEITT